jgi:hypothetical protein
MSERPTVDDILARQQAERARVEERRKQRQEELQRLREQQAPFASVRDCYREQVEGGDQGFFEEFARRIVALTHDLEQRGLLNGLLGRLQDDSCSAHVQDRDARRVVSHLLQLAGADDLPEVTRRLREADGLPFTGQVSDWLRYHLEWEALDLQRAAAGHWAVAETINGVTWPVLQPNEPDPLAVLTQACDIAESALGTLERVSQVGRVSPALVIEGLWTAVVRDVAERVGREAPALPEEIPGVPEARGIVASVRNWGRQSNPDPALTVTAPPTDADPLFPPQTLDPKRCPGCQAPVPPSGRLSSEYNCAQCGRWRLHTGVLVLPIAGPLGTPPKVIRLSAPYWCPVDPSAQALQASPNDPPMNLELDTREVPLTAPAGTHSPLREAYEAVANALFDAAEIRRCPSKIRPMFEDLARALLAARGTAQGRYAAAELLLQAVADEDGRCAHQEALNTTARINDACGHVMLGIVPFERATAHIQAVPAFDLPGLLGAMRRQTSRATVRLQEAGSRPALQTGQSEPTGDVTADIPQAAEAAERSEALTSSVREEGSVRTTQPSPGARLRKPNKDAMTVYRYWFASGLKQVELAKDSTLMELLGRSVSQGTISRWLRQVEDWIKAGNVIPDLSESSISKPLPMDPERIDLGPHGEHRPKHLRKRQTSEGAD